MKKPKNQNRKTSMKNKKLAVIIPSIIVLILLAVLCSVLYSTQPRIIKVEVYPPKIVAGEVMLIGAEIRDNLGIIEAKAEIYSESGTDTAELYLDSGTRKSGIWTGYWIAHSTEEKWYPVKITAKNFLGKKASFETQYFDPIQNHTAAEVTAGTFDAGNFIFPNNLAATGNITANSSILIKKIYTPTNNTGYGKLYYYAGGDAIDSETKLLLHMDGSAGGTTFTDTSSGAKTVTNAEAHDSYTKLASHFEGADAATAYSDPVAGAYTFVGTAQLDTAQKKFGSASLLLDGDSDYVTLPDSDSWNFGSGDFTVDTWVRWNSLTGVQTMASQYDDSDNNFQFQKESDNSFTFFASNAGSTNSGYFYTAAQSLSTNTWYHLAFVRYGSTGKWYINGNYVTTIPAVAWGTFPALTSTLHVGNVASSYYLNGWLDELRISKGVARWTANFAPPGSAYGNVSYNTTSYKFGTAAAEFKGSGDYLVVADSADFDFGTGDFSIDYWIKPAIATGTLRHFGIGNYGGGQGGFVVKSDGDNNVLQVGFNAAFINYAWNPSANTWYHLALVRSGTNLYVFINGAQDTAAQTDSTDHSTTTGVYIGCWATDIDAFVSGYLDEFRISKGIARWTANFNVPTLAYGTPGGLMFMYQNGTIKTLAGEA